MGFKCETNRTGETFSLDMLPAGATWDAGTATLTWKTGLDAAAVYKLSIKAMPSGDTGELKIGVADNFEDPANVPIKDPTKYTEEYGLPVLHMWPSEGVAGAKPSLLMQRAAIWANTCLPLCIPSAYAPIKIVYRGKTYEAEGHYRGASSLSFLKLNYTIRFDKGDKFTEPFLAGGAIKNRRHIALITTFDDNSHLRWRMSFEAWNRLQPKIRIEHMSVVVYEDGQYLGLYALSDKIDDNTLERSGLSKAGNLFMGVDHNASFDPQGRGLMGSLEARERRCPFEGFSKKNGLPEECDEQLTFNPSAYDDLIPLIDFVSQADDATFNRDVSQVIDVRNYVDWWIHGSAIVATDSYAKNAIHYHDPKGGPWQVVIWDFNASFGQRFNTTRADFRINEPMFFATIPSPAPAVNNLWRRLLLHPTIGPMMKARYAEVLRNELKVETLLAQFDSMVEAITPSARRDERKWQERHRAYWNTARAAAMGNNEWTTFDEEVAYMRSWIKDRWGWLATKMP